MGVQVAVSYGESCREVAAQLLQQLREGSLLGRRASVCGEAFAVQSPFVADADGVTVVIEAMRTDFFQRAPPPERAAGRDVSGRRV